MSKFLGTCFTLAHLACTAKWRRASTSGNHHRVRVKYSAASRPWGLLGCAVPWGFHRNVWLVSKEEEGMPNVHPAARALIQDCMHYFGKKAYSFSFYIFFLKSTKLKHGGKCVGIHNFFFFFFFFLECPHMYSGFRSSLPVRYFSGVYKITLRAWTFHQTCDFQSNATLHSDTAN